MGHAVRCARLAATLDGEVHWLLPETGTDSAYGRAEVIARIGGVPDTVIWETESSGRYDLIVADMQECTEAEMGRLKKSGLVVGIDLGGEGRRYCPYLIDCFPTPPGFSLPNVADTGLLPLFHPVRDEWPAAPESVLLAFGGERDEARTIGALNAIRNDPRFDELKLTVSVPDSIRLPQGVRRLNAPGALSQELHKFDLVITHFGLTAFEAVWAKVPVVLVNPTPYHALLGRQSNFPDAGTGTVRTAELASSIENWTKTVDVCRTLRPGGTTLMSDFLAALKIPENLTGPGLPEGNDQAVARFFERSFFRHQSSGLVYMMRFRETTVRYDHDYFFQEYRNQYGRTYIEDFPAIMSIGSRRIGDIERVQKKRGRPSTALRFLDIGCAFGPFLQALTAAGHEAVGIDVLREATDYARERIGVETICKDFRILGDSERQSLGAFDVVTMWYVIEHFPDLDGVFRAVRSFLKPGGLFAFSTPNLDGVSGRRDMREFLRRSPDDHFTVWSAGHLEKPLDLAGFRLLRTRVTGHHPERIYSGNLENRPFLRRILDRYSKITRSGDTFEGIAELIQ